MTTDDLTPCCACVACGVRLFHHEYSPTLLGAWDACGHPRCAPCERMHPGVCGVCTPPEPWTPEELRDRTVADYLSAEHWITAAREERDPAGWWAAQMSSIGHSRPHTYCRETWANKVKLWEPIAARDRGATPPTLTMTTRELARLVLASAPPPPPPPPPPNPTAAEAVTAAGTQLRLF